MGRHLDLRTQEGAPSAVTRARYRRRDCGRRAARGAARVVHSRCQTACVSSFPHHGLACGFSCLPLHLHCVRLVTRPRNEGAGGAPGGALPVVALVRRDATLAPVPCNRDAASRRSTVALSAQEPLRTRHYLRDPASRLLTASHCSWRATAPGVFVSAVYEPRSPPLPAPPAGSSPETAPHERGWRIYITSSHRSQ